MNFDPRIVLSLPSGWRIGFFYVPRDPEKSFGCRPFGIFKAYDGETDALVVWQLVLLCLEIRVFKFEPCFEKEKKELS